MNQTTLIIINGLSATGKTTLAKKIGEELRLPVFHKDDFKEMIADNVEIQDPLDSGLGKSSRSILFYIAQECLKNNISLVIEGDLVDTKEAKQFISYLQTSKKRVIEVVCVAELSIRLERYKSRERHPIHPRITGPADEEIFKNRKLFVLEVGKLLTVDTSNFSEIPYQSIYDTINSANF